MRYVEAIEVADTLTHSLTHKTTTVTLALVPRVNDPVCHLNGF